jgi:hypothetical protein
MGCTVCTAKALRDRKTCRCRTCLRLEIYAQAGHVQERERRHSAFGEDMGVATDIEIEISLMWCRM